MQPIANTRSCPSGFNEVVAGREPVAQTGSIFAARLSWVDQVVLLGLEAADDRTIWQRAKTDGYVIVTRNADFQELSLVWGQPPQVIWLKTFNQQRAATLKALLDSRELIETALVKDQLSCVEISA